MIKPVIVEARDDLRVVIGRYCFSIARDNDLIIAEIERIDRATEREVTHG